MPPISPNEQILAERDRLYHVLVDLRSYPKLLNEHATVAQQQVLRVARRDVEEITARYESDHPDVPERSITPNDDGFR